MNRTARVTQELLHTGVVAKADALRAEAQLRAVVRLHAPDSGAHAALRQAQQASDARHIEFGRLEPFVRVNTRRAQLRGHRVPGQAVRA